MRPITIILAGCTACSQDLSFADDEQPSVEQQLVSVPPRWLDLIWSLDTSRSMLEDWPHMIEQLRAVGSRIDGSTLNVRIGLGYPADFRVPPSMIPTHSGGFAMSGWTLPHIDLYVPATNGEARLLYYLNPHASFKFLYDFLKTRSHAESGQYFPNITGKIILITVSDDDDLSNEPTYEQFVSYLDHLAGPNRTVIYAAIVDTTTGPDACGKAAPKHIDAAVHTGGRVIPFCAPHVWSVDVMDMIDEHLDAPTVIALPPNTCSNATVTLDGRVFAACEVATFTDPCPPWTMSAIPPAAHIPLRELHRTRELMVRQVEDCR